MSFGCPQLRLRDEPHHLPGRAVDRQRYGAGEAALRIKTDGVRGKREGFGLARKQFFRRTRQQIGVGGRPPLLVSRTGFLRERRSEHDEKQHQAEPQRAMARDAAET